MSNQAKSNKRQVMGKIAAILGIALLLSPAHVLGGVLLLWAAGRWHNKAWQRRILGGLIVEIVALSIAAASFEFDGSSPFKLMILVLAAIVLCAAILFMLGCGIAMVSSPIVEFMVGRVAMAGSSIARFLKRPADTRRALEEIEQARQRYQESLAVSQAQNDRPSLAYTNYRLGNLHLQTNDLSAARACYQEALRLALELSRASLAAEVICGLAEVELAQGRVEPALAALAWVQAQAGVDQGTRSRAARLIKGAAGRLSPELAEPALARGRSLPLEEVAASFLED